jgi:hypothetical protein
VFLQNIGTHLQDYTVLRPKGLTSEPQLLWKPGNLKNLICVKYKNYGTCSLSPYPVWPYIMKVLIKLQWP